MSFYALTKEANSLIENQINFDLYKAFDFNDFIYRSKYKIHELVKKYQRSFTSVDETKYESFTYKDAKLLLNLFEIYLIDKDFEE